MKPASAFVVVLVTVPSLKVGRFLARGVLEAKLAACANLVPKLESHYWWKGKLERSTEVLILFKTRKSRAAQLEKYLLAHHPYETPEIVTLKLESGTARYLDWLAASVP